MKQCTTIICIFCLITMIFGVLLITDGQIRNINKELIEQNQRIKSVEKILKPYSKINQHIIEHSKLSQSMAADVTSSIVVESHKNGLEPEFVTAVIKVESSFNPFAVSNKHAKGLMQLTDGIAKAYHCHDVYDTRQNIAAGCKYLSDLRKRFGEAKNDQIYVMSFNCGPNRPISQIVRLSGNYAGKVNRGYRRLKYGQRD